MIPLARRKLSCRGGGVGGYHFLNQIIFLYRFQDGRIFFCYQYFLLYQNFCYIFKSIVCYGYSNFQLKVLASFSFRLTNGKKNFVILLNLLIFAIILTFLQVKLVNLNFIVQLLVYKILFSILRGRIFSLLSIQFKQFCLISYVLTNKI